MKPKVRYPGVRRLGPGLYEVRVRAVDPRTGSLKSRKKQVHARSLGAAFEACHTLRRELRDVLTCAPAAPGQRAPSLNPVVPPIASTAVDPALTTVVSGPTRAASTVAPGMTLGAFARLWMKDAVFGGKRLSTIDERGRNLTKHILPLNGIGDKPIDQIRVHDIKDWLRAARAATMEDGTPYAPQTIAGWYRNLKALVRTAMGEFELGRDPTGTVRCETGESVRTTKEQPNTLRLAEVRRFLAAAAAESPEVRAMVIVGLLGGCRLGELLALDWSDIREDEGIILVRRSQHCGVETETKKSRWRSVWLHPMVREALEAHRRASLGEKVERLARGLVFPSKKTGGYHTASFLAKPFARMRKRAGITIRFTPQGMRRTANNLRRQLGIDRTVIRDEIGHASDRMTDHYSTVTVHEKRDAVERLVRAIDGASDAAEVAPVVAPGVAPEVAPRASVDGKAAPSGSKSATKSA